MHDPQTQAIQIRYPWGRRVKWKKDGLYHKPFITIWHVDPETDGSDDSCGWHYPKLTEKQKRRLDCIVNDEARQPYFLRQRSKKWIGLRTEPETLLRGLLLLVADRLEIPLTFEQAARMAAERIHRSDGGDNAGMFCFLPGYHSNHSEDREEDRKYQFGSIAHNLAGSLLRMRRPWYRHPRWHIWHWKIQIHPLQDLQRKLFSRCAHCGKSFPWGYAPVSRQWYAKKRRWYQGEKGVYHHNCSRPESDGAMSATTKAHQYEGT